MNTPVGAPLRIGDILVRDGLVSEADVQRALEEARTLGVRIGFSLVKLGLVSEHDLVQALSRQWKVPAVDISRIAVDPRVLRLVPADVATKHLVLPLRRSGRTLTVAMMNPQDVEALDVLRFVSSCEIEPVLVGEYTLRRQIEKHYDTTDQKLHQILTDLMSEEDIEIASRDPEEASVLALQEQIEQAPVVKFVNSLLSDALAKGASDIHIEPFEKEIRVRYRIDGALQEVMKPPQRMKAAITARIKILASLNIAERRVPQDGRIRLRVKTRTIDFRVSTLPVTFGEKIVLRILDQQNLTLDLGKFGFEPKAEQDFFQAIANPYGMVLVTGPTGSGKTTTLYSALSRINTADVNIMTAEDPVEYNLEGINQVQVRPDIGMSFAAALKSFLRQDPNIIMVGEIRDLETGGIAIKAALTGHLVLSTLHTNDAPSTITRLIDMGLEPFNVAGAITLVTAQRLVRRICGACRQPVTYSESVLSAARLPPNFARTTTLYRGRGCEECGGTGYRGRQGLYEVMAISPRLRRLIMEEAGTDALRAAAIEEGMLTLRMDGLRKIERGITTLEEVVKETAEAAV